MSQIVSRGVVRIRINAKGSAYCRAMSRISYDTINQQVKDASYAVRGPIVTRSMELNSQLATGAHNLPFDEIISCNIGNPHSLAQAPISYIRDVLSLVMNPTLLSHATFPADLVQRVNRYLSSFSGVGAYSESQGIKAVRDEISDFLSERDGFAADSRNIFLTNGASDGVRLCMQTIMRNPQSGFQDGVLTPIPQYPLYSALITLLNGSFVAYHLDESKEWSCTPELLTESLANAAKKGITVRALVIINPGNPTGQIMCKSVMVQIVQWCREHQICLMADEVYQENIWKQNLRFHSFRKVAYECDAFQGDRPPLQLISFHSISKGYLGECGLRGGYFELLGISDEVKAELYKLASISLCSNTIGQLATGLMVRPPKYTDESYPLYIAERDSILHSLSRRAIRMKEALNSLEGVSCTSIAGALYAFPTINLPSKAIAEARKLGMEPDAMYCIKLLEATGIVVVPGSGFGQLSGTYHFRTTILPPEKKLDKVITLLRKFHEQFMSKYME